MVCIVFDLEKGNDTTWRYGILKRLHDFGLRGRMPKFIKDFLGDGTSASELILPTHNPMNRKKKGVPKGSVLSVTLFSVAINSIITSLREAVSFSLYLDDPAIWYSASRMSTAERRLQHAIDMTSRWEEEYGFRFSPTKSGIAVQQVRNRKEITQNGSTAILLLKQTYPMT